jgi:hypothetical protein
MSSTKNQNLPTEKQVLKAIYESNLHRHGASVLKIEYKDGIDISKPSGAIMEFARKLVSQSVESLGP